MRILTPRLNKKSCLISETFQVDPMTEGYYPRSPYSWVMNNPLKFMDPTGMFSTNTDEDGNVVAVYDDGGLGVYRHQGKRDEAARTVQREYSTDNTGVVEKEWAKVYIH